MLTERHHAFLSAAFYRRLKHSGVQNYRQIFRFATQKYAEQRGSRMALRALRDGRELDFASYRFYGEWQFTPEYLAEKGDFVEYSEQSGDLIMKIHACPWSEQYLAMDLPDGAAHYCAVLDRSIVRGFNPELDFTVERTMHEKRDYCVQRQHGGACPDLEGREARNLRDFTYHSGHVLSAFSAVVLSVCADGEGICGRVLADFERQFGEQAADELKKAASQDFSRI